MAQRQPRHRLPLPARGPGLSDGDPDGARAPAAKPVPPRAARRLAREARTVRLMLELHCRDHHGPGPVLCAECDALRRYVEQRLARCPFAADKPTCLRCTVHCFEPTMRERIRAVMRYAGPRMTWRHPLLALRHLLDGGRKPTARKPPKPD